MVFQISLKWNMGQTKEDISKISISITYSRITPWLDSSNMYYVNQHTIKSITKVYIGETKRSVTSWNSQAPEAGN